MSSNQSGVSNTMGLEDKECGCPLCYGSLELNPSGSGMVGTNLPHPDRKSTTYFYCSKYEKEYTIIMHILQGRV